MAIYRTYLYLFAFLLFFTSFTAPTEPDPQYKYIWGSSPILAKNYYLIYLLSNLPDANALIRKDRVLSGLAKAKSDSLGASLSSCGSDGRCFVGRMKFTEGEITEIGERLAAIYQSGNALDKLIDRHLIPSGTYVLFDNLPKKELLRKAWEQDARGINFVIDVYAGGGKPNYPKIDSISFAVKDPRDTATYANAYVNLLYNATNLLYQSQRDSAAFYAPSLASALMFLQMNDREQAADFEPMAETENKAAYGQVSQTNWSKYPYSVILVPGAGPSEPGVALSAEAMIRCRLAAMQYKKGLAPFVVVSGGKVHPYKTQFCEAIEMKHYMTGRLGVPEAAVIIDPHARHTTTNMRNTVRMIYRYGMPFEKPGLTCTTRGQSNMIGTTLPGRCNKELGLVPYKPGRRLSETEIEFYPLIQALHIDPQEPMDP